MGRGSFADVITRMREQQSRKDCEAAERELAQHVASRAALRENMAEDERCNAAAQAEHDAAREALQAFGRKYSWEQRNGEREVVAEQARLSAAANRPLVLRKYSAGHSPRELLIRGCRDVELQQRLQAAAEAWRALWDLHSRKEIEAGKASEKASDARRERVDILGRVRSQYGPEGCRWRRIEQDDQVSITGVCEPDGTSRIHPQNLEFLNNQLVRPNRIIREAAAVMAADNGQLTRDLAAAANAVELAEQSCVDSEV